MLTNKYDEVFEVLYGYLNDESKYEPLVTKNAPLRSTKFPVVEIKSRELPFAETTRQEEWVNRIEVTINIYAIEKVMTKTITKEINNESVTETVSYKVSSLEIVNELMGLIDKAMMEMNFTMTENNEVENADKNVYRRLLEYTAGVNGLNNKLMRRF